MLFVILSAGRMSGHEISMTSFTLTRQELNFIDRVYLIGCGTSYHAGLIAKNLIEGWARIPTEVEVASEFRYRNPIITPTTLVVAVSQSGETAGYARCYSRCAYQGRQSVWYH